MLKGVGATLALPLLETMGWADPPKGGASKPPVRMAFIFAPFGMDNANFWPKDEKIGQNTALPRIIEPLRTVLSDCLILGGVSHKLEVDPDSPHARETTGWLTGYTCKKNAVENAISADQIAAQRIGSYTALPSLELNMREGRTGGNCDKGYSCAYLSHISWRSPTQPVPREANPRAALDRLFSSRRSTQKTARGPVVDANKFATTGVESDASGPSLDQSMVSLVLGHAKDLRAKISVHDQRKMDEYLDSVNELEKRVAAIERQQQEAAQAQSSKAGKKYKSSPLITVEPAGAVRFDEKAKVMFDIITLAFQSDTTRVASLMYGHHFANGSHPEIGIPENHHSLSHHGGDQAKLEKICQINVFHMQQFAYLVQRMKNLQEGSGSLLDNCMLLYGCNIGDGDAHNYTKLPTILAGKGGGTITSGRYVPQVKGNMCELLMAMLARVGAPVDALGDGKKMLPDLT
jgi:hypothetical protein